MTVFGHSVAFNREFKSQRRCVGEDPREALPQTKVAIIAPRDEHCSRTIHITISMFSNQEFQRSICPEAEATFEPFSTHAHHAESLSVFVVRALVRTSCCVARAEPHATGCGLPFSTYKN